MANAKIHPTANPRSNFWMGRIWNFNKQMFPLYPNVVIFLLQFIVNYLMIRNFFPLVEKQISGDGISVDYLRGGGITGHVMTDLIVGSITLVLFVYLFRAFDEVKDYPTDKLNFPDRPLVSGVLSLRDIKILQAVVIAGLVGLNYGVMWGRDVIPAFNLVLVFTLLASQWFFFEKQIRPSLPLALVTHNPVLYLYQIYILSFFTLDWNFSAVAALLFLIGDGLPGTAWEISRKIRGKRQEDTYVTYSRIWGPYVPTLLVALLTLVGWSFTLLAATYIQPGWVMWFWAPSALVWFFYLYKMVSFWRNQDIAPNFRVYVEIFKFLQILAFIACLIFGTTSGWPA